MTLRTAAAHRNLLYLLSLKELRTRYKKSVLGWAWSLVNPLAQVVIFSVIFLYVFSASPQPGNPSGVTSFPLYFLSGLLPWNFFAITTAVSMGSVQGGSGLIKKVRFPHEHLVFSVVIAQFVTLLIETTILVAAYLVYGRVVVLWLPVLLVLYVMWALFTTGVALALSAANVFFHDVSYLWSIVLQLLFYATPIIYFPQIVTLPILRWIANYGPTGTYIVAFHEVLYDGRWPSAERWAYMLAVGVAVFFAGVWVFEKLSPRFAEEL